MFFMSLLRLTVGFATNSSSESVGVSVSSDRAVETVPSSHSSGSRGLRLAARPHTP